MNNGKGEKFFMRSVVKESEEIREICQSVYVEVLGENMVIYRVTESIIIVDDEEKHTYGVEIESNYNGIHSIEAIKDFSTKLPETVEFTEKLIRNSVMPSSLYDIALDYLGSCI